MESPVHVTCWDHHHRHTFHGASKLPTIKFAYIEKSIANDCLLFWHPNESKKKKHPLLSSTYVPALWVYRNWMRTHHSVHGFHGWVASCQISCWSNIYMLMNKSIMLAYSMVMHY
jgi:hypothetical protein